MLLVREVLYCKWAARTRRSSRTLWRATTTWWSTAGARSTSSRA